MRFPTLLQFPRLFLCLLSVSIIGCGGNPEFATKDTPKAMSATPAAAPATVATFAGIRNAYKISKTSTGFSVKELSGAGTTVNLSGQTSAKFADVTVNLLVGDKSKTIPAASLKTLIELYIAFFNRVPDADGMSYWIDQIKAGVNVDQLSASFYDAAVQFTALTGYSATMSNEQFVRIIYQNVLGRSGATAPPDADVAYWAGELASGKPKGFLVATMLNSAHTFANDPEWGWVPQLLDNKVTVGTFFAIQQGLNYNTSEESISKGMDIAKAVTSTDISLAKTKIGMTDVLFDLTAAISNSEFEKVQSIINAHCLTCHSTQRTEGGIALHTADLIRRNADALYIMTVVTRAMPQDGVLSADEIATISAWYLAGAK
ncbi:DUF4214 domain-containing protein [Undibacterium flavidum]|uniref:DUF4214 domain-containing protein n=1 Tax=Undibacterium flavidum TaxID=2762297 RepID=A0ABR6YAG9_9BURK|nr:DUF4214 domain-containing protein [Undibacterium flavidum]MBC3873144.1 DUF4214 domain-containing protein [Undibacterium flavidum]